MNLRRSVGGAGEAPRPVVRLPRATPLCTRDRIRAAPHCEGHMTHIWIASTHAIRQSPPVHRQPDVSRAFERSVSRVPAISDSVVGFRVRDQFHADRYPERSPPGMSRESGIAGGRCGSLTQGQRQLRSSRVGRATRSLQRRFTSVNRARMKSRRVARQHSAHHVYARKSLRNFWLGRKSLNGTPSAGMEHLAGSIAFGDAGAEGKRHRGRTLKLGCAAQ